MQHHRTVSHVCSALPDTVSLLLHTRPLVRVAMWCGCGCEWVGVALGNVNVALGSSPALQAAHQSERYSLTVCGASSLGVRSAAGGNRSGVQIYCAERPGPGPGLASLLWTAGCLPSSSFSCVQVFPPEAFKNLPFFVQCSRFHNTTQIVFCGGQGVWGLGCVCVCVGWVRETKRHSTIATTTQPEHPAWLRHAALQSNPSGWLPLQPIEPKECGGGQSTGRCKHRAADSWWRVLVAPWNSTSRPDLGQPFFAPLWHASLRIMTTVVVWFWVVLLIHSSIFDSRRIFAFRARRAAVPCWQSRHTALSGRSFCDLVTCVSRGTHASLCGSWSFVGGGGGSILGRAVVGAASFWRVAGSSTWLARFCSSLNLCTTRFLCTADCCELSYFGNPATLQHFSVLF